MSYSSRWGDADVHTGSTSRDQRREEDRRARELDAARKIADFLSATSGKEVVWGSCIEFSAAKIELVPTKAGHLRVHHRTHEMLVDCSGVNDAEAKLREWCKREMPHATVFPRPTKAN